MQESFESESAKWEKKLVEEGMPEELPLLDSSEGHTPAFEAGISDLTLYFVEHPREEYYAHREKLAEIQARMEAAGATREEIESLSEDFVRETEDIIDHIQLAAQTRAQTLVEKRLTLIGRPDAMVRDVLKHITAGAPSLVNKEALRIVAERAVATASPQ